MAKASTKSSGTAKANDGNSGDTPKGGPAYAEPKEHPGGVPVDDGNFAWDVKRREEIDRRRKRAALRRERGEDMKDEDEFEDFG